ncbi:carboxypeptidase-like regulatory domain-containing protein [Candidatus Palauibacter sp.]|uniref:carboxypeptidase-like regulatory domain-containing protein n=1 Tax=Candidatus Palauibacter sp. TaxID=3101350 RepID=UPI003AF305E0
MVNWHGTIAAYLGLIMAGCGADPAVPPSVPPLDGGQSGLNIAGTVTDSAGNGVGDVRVEGFVRRDADGIACRNPSGPTRDARTRADGRYQARFRLPLSGGTWPGCLSLTFTPPEISGLRTVSIDSMRVTVYDQWDPALKRDTLRVNVVLPPVP